MRVNNLEIKKWGFGFLTISLSIVFLVFQVQAAIDGSDAIAVRIMPNPSHYSIDSWYKQQGYQGSPQKLLVDGYEAIRDGRTVFINAANIDSNKIYTNIYLISYNQESNIKTVDILGQLVSHWKFNNNISEAGTCSISTIMCNADKDCPDSYICSTGQAVTGPNITNINQGKCVPKGEASCLNDSDCPANIFCSSPKAKIVRDVKRLGQLNDIKDSLKAANSRDSHYPDLVGGTYIPGNSISTWPSWKETLWPKLAGLSLAVDPINVLGYCSGFEPATCWKKDSGSGLNNFYQVDASGKPILPAGSYAFLYTSEKNGINFSLCAAFETKGLYDTAEGQLSSQSCLSLAGHSGVSANTAPEIKSSFLDGNSGLEFNGYIKAYDRENDSISWRLETGATNFSSWSATPILRDAGDINQKKIYAAKTGNTGNYPVVLVLRDSRGAEARYPLILKVTANKPIIEAENVEYSVNSVVPLNFSYYIQSNNGIGSYSMSLKEGSPDIFAGISGTRTDLGTTRLRIDKSVLIPIGTNLPTDRKLIYQIVASDQKGAQATKDVIILLKAEAPYLNFDCDTNARVNKTYPLSGTPCFIGNTKDSNHLISYAMSSFNGLRLSPDGNGGISLSGAPFTFSPLGSPVTIMAVNEYGAASSKTFILKVNNYCGDGVKQTPNSEGRGGSHNDGLEDCDGVDGTTKNVANSSISFQYGCSTLSSAAIYPILDGSSCIFAAGDKGGGYCGDNLCQFTINGMSLENACNCPMDCGRAAVGTDCGAPITPTTTGVCGNGVIDVGEECDGSNVNNKTCQDFDLNYSPYGLSCNANCKFVTSTCYAKSCVRNSDCANGILCKTDNTGANYYCTNLHISHGCNSKPYSTAALKTQCAGSYTMQSDGTYGVKFRDDATASSVKFKECQTPCETSIFATDNSYCDWVVDNGKCLIGVTCTAAGCDDNNPCTDDSCSTSGQCLHTNNSSSTACEVSYGTCKVSGQKVCNTTAGSCTGTVDPTIANCANKTCGADNGCGGKCIVNNFGTATCKAYNYYEDGLLTCSVDGMIDLSKCLSGKCGDGNCDLVKEDKTSCPADCKDACSANTYLSGTTCTPCPNGKFSPVGSTSVSQCVDCLSDANCNGGYYCQLNTSTFAGCNNTSANTCQRKCWDFLETDQILTFLEGDTVSSYYCSAIAVDNPRCGAPTSCPSSCNSGGAPTKIGTVSGNSCYIQRTLAKSWYDRGRYKCYSNQYTKHFFEDACALTIGYTEKWGKVNENGTCAEVVSCGDGRCSSSENCNNCINDCGGCYCTNDSDCYSTTCSGGNTATCYSSNFSCTGPYYDQYNCEMSGYQWTGSGNCSCN